MMVSLNASDHSSFITLQTPIFECNPSTLLEYQVEKPWKSHPKYFTNCRINTTAVIKMIKHTLHGVHTGNQQNG